MPDSNLPFIPEKITVHLGAPDDSSARNVTVDFPYYIKNVASSEIYPTWPENAIRANVYAIISHTLNRVYTEWYRSKGYNFDITNNTQYDHYYVDGRDIFIPISDVVDELFNDYLVRLGNAEPLFTRLCEENQVQCNELSKWGTVDLAKKGLTPYEIITNYYGDNINIVENARINTNIPKYPGTPLKIGSAGKEVSTIKVQLNRISRNYPTIPKIYPVDGIFVANTEQAVEEFQRVFNLPQTGFVDKSTWYKIKFIYISIKKLAELNSEGLTPSEAECQYNKALQFGDIGDIVKFVQYYLAFIGAYYNAVPAITITGDYDQPTVDAVKAFQEIYGLPVTGIIDKQTWDDFYRAYAGIVENAPVNVEGEKIVLYPGSILAEGITNEYVKVLQKYLSYIHQTYPNIPEVSATGYFGPITKQAVMAFQKQFGLPQTGSVGSETWYYISSLYSDLKSGYEKQPGQFAGYTIS